MDFDLIKCLIQPYLTELSQAIGDINDSFLTKDNNYFESYFKQQDKQAFICTVQSKIAGFALINKVGLNKIVDWNMGEFFIAKEFQGQHIGQDFALSIFRDLNGEWQVPVLPKNKKAILFWQKVINTMLKTEIEPISVISNSDFKPRMVFNFLLKPSCHDL